MNPFADLHAKITTADHVLILIHEDPDGDAIGAGVALALGLKTLGKTVCVPFSGMIRETAMSLNPLEILSPSIPASFAPDLIVILDSSAPNLLDEDARANLSASTAPTINIDHHASNQFYADVNIVNANASSTCEMIAQYLMAFGYEISAQIAGFLLGGLISDTGRFAYKNTTASTLEIAAYLIQKGADLPQIVQDLEAKISYEGVIVWGKALAGVKRAFGGQVVWASVPQASYALAEDAGQQVRAIGAFLRRTKNARLVFLCKEREAGGVGVSFRSYGDVNCAVIAQNFGGGGHHGAAGCRLEGSIEQAETEILAFLERADLF